MSCAVALAPTLAAFKPADGLVMAALVVFAWWGARRGALRQMLSLAVLVGSLWVAGRFAGDLEPTVEALTSLDAGTRLALAWAALVFAGLVVGAIVLSFACCRLPARATGGADRVLGGALGMLKGGLVLVLAGYLLLAAAGSEPVPGLSRPDDGGAAPAATWVERVQGSVTARALTSASGWLQAWLDLPGWVEARVEDVDRALRAPVPERRPTER